MKRFWQLIRTGDLQMIAASLSFTTVLSMIPFLAVAMATIHMVDSSGQFYTQLESLVLQYIQDPIGQDGVQMIRKAFYRIHAGRMGFYGAIFLVMASVFLVNDIEKAIHKIWSLSERRPLYLRLFFSWVFLIVAPILLAVVFAISSMKAVAGITSFLPPWIYSLSLLFLTLMMIYKFMPNTHVLWRASFWGAAFSTLGLTILVKSFKLVTTKVFVYSKVYGSLAAVPGFLIWILVIWYVVLVGASITATRTLDSRSRV
jgi:membrane protein